jgi:hypothetical protein
VKLSKPRARTRTELYRAGMAAAVRAAKRWQSLTPEQRIVWVGEDIPDREAESMAVTCVHAFLHELTGRTGVDAVTATLRNSTLAKWLAFWRHFDRRARP